VETINATTSTPVNNRRSTRSALTLPPTEEEPVETAVEKTPVKPKGKHARTKSRTVSTVNKNVSEIDDQSRRISRSTQFLEELPLESIQNEPEPNPETAEIESSLPKKKRGRPSKIREFDDETPEPQTLPRRTRQSIVSQPVIDVEIVNEEAPARQPKALVIPKKKRASTRAARTTSTALVELPEIEEKEIEGNLSSRTRLSRYSVIIPVVEIPEPKVESESEPEPVPVRGKKASRGRGRSTMVRNSTVATPVDDVPKPKARSNRATSKRDISAVYPDITDLVSPPAKRKASGLRSIQKIPTPSSDSESDVFEDSKSTFSDIEEIPIKPKPRAMKRNLKKRSKVFSEERETEDGPPSTIYHSADDRHPTSPTQSGIMAKSKREMVDNAKKELEEEIWRERVANGEVGIGGSSEDDEKENAAEEKGKKPTRTVRGKGSKGRKPKVNGKSGQNTKVMEVPVAAEAEDDVESNGECHALVVKAMISPLRRGPRIPPDPASEEESSEDDQLQNGTVTPIQPPNRKVLNWTPAKIEEVSPVSMVNGIVREEEEDMTVEQWMRWVINDEVNRLEQECEKLVRNLEKEGGRARRLLENLV
jgi:hypothetical protein